MGGDFCWILSYGRVKWIRRRKAADGGRVSGWKTFMNKSHTSPWCVDGGQFCHYYVPRAE